MRSVYLCLLLVIVFPLYSQQKKVSSKKIVLTNQLTLNDQEFGAVLITPQEGLPVSGVIKKQYRNDYLLDIDDIFTTKKIPPKKNRVPLIPKGKKSIAVNAKTDLTNFPGMVFYGRSGLYRLDINNVIAKNGVYRYCYLPHTIEIVTHLGFDVNFNILGQTSDVFFSGFFMINFYTENRQKRNNGYTPLVQLRVGYGTSPLLKIPTLGLLFGGSQYIFDFRSPQEGIGWSMLINGGMSFDFSSNITLQTFLTSLTIGGEIEFKAIYNFHKYVGVTFGLLIGYHLTPLAIIDPNSYDQNIRANLSVGFIF